jgi:hypothetical protein
MADTCYRSMDRPLAGVYAYPQHARLNRAATMRTQLRIHLHMT